MGITLTHQKLYLRGSIRFVGGECHVCATLLELFEDYLLPHRHTLTPSPF